jgi:hypothetical protein
MRLTLCTYRLAFVVLLLLLAFPILLKARLMEAATYQEMFDKADLVVIAKPVSTKGTSEHTTLPGWHSIHVVGVNTEFETELVLKGKKDVKNLVLHHYKIDDVAERLPISDGPTLASFNPKEHNKYLLFLIKQPDGKYAPATGQVDPAAFSVIKLPSIP